MKKIVSLFFILALCGTFLPAVLSYEHKEIVLFSTVEEEQPDGTKEVKEKETAKAVFENSLRLLSCNPAQAFYPNVSILFADDPCIGNPTPPPDSSC